MYIFTYEAETYNLRSAVNRIQDVQHWVSEESTQIVIIGLGVESRCMRIAQQCSVLTQKPKTKLPNRNLQLYLSYKVMTH